MKGLAASGIALGALGSSLGSGVAEAADPVSLTAFVDAGHNQKPFEWYSEDVKRMFNVDLSIENAPFSAVYEKAKLEFLSHTGAYDIVTFYPLYLGDFARSGYLVPLGEYNQRKSLELDDVVTGFREFYTKFQGELYTAPYDGDELVFYYRKDLFNHPREKADFGDEYGYELSAPETWDEYTDIAEFFTRSSGERLGDETLSDNFYGGAFFGKKFGVWAWWANRFAAYGGKYFDEDFQPGINTDAAVRALEDMKEFKQYTPPNVMGLGYPELKNVFLNRNVAMVIQWADVGKKAADPEQSQVVGKVGYSHIPGVEQDDGSVYWRSLMPVGRVLSVNQDSPHPWKAYQVIQYLSAVTSIDDVSTSATGLDPYRYSHFNQPDEYEMFDSTDQAQNYLDAVQLNLENGYPEPIIPGGSQYENVLSTAIQDTLTGKSGSRAALDEAARKWNQITDRFGREKQKSIYESLTEGWEEEGLW